MLPSRRPSGAHPPPRPPAPAAAAPWEAADHNPGLSVLSLCSPGLLCSAASLTGQLQCVFSFGFPQKRTLK